jgi:Fe2+ or Zn2+ uptake regulation protein
LVICSSILNYLLRKMLNGDKCHSKHLSQYAYSVANKEFLRGVIDGIFGGDGYLKEKYDKTINITSLDMIYDIKYIISILGGAYCSIRKSLDKKNGIILGRKVNLKNQYTLKLLRTSGKKVTNISELLIKDSNVDIFNTSYKNIYNNIENFYTCKILEKEKQENPFIVYNIQVEEDESYVTEHFVSHNCNFNASGETVVDPEDIERLRKECIEPKHKSWVDRNYHIWKPYNHQGKYMIIADVARGDGADYSVFHVFNSVNMEQVAEYQGRIEPENFCRLLVDTGKEYGNALMVIEVNNIGYTVAQKVIELGYRNMYYSSKSTHEYIDPNAALGDSNAVPGFTTSPKTRPLIISKLDEYIRNRVVAINSARTIREMEKFIWVNGRPEAQKGYNDDLIMSLAIGCWVRETTLIHTQKDVELSRALLNAIGRSNVTLNTTIPGMVEHPRIEMDQRKATYQQYMWLIKG